jgi:hypothetical protein
MLALALVNVGGLDALGPRRRGRRRRLTAMTVSQATFTNKQAHGAPGERTVSRKRATFRGSGRR